LSMIAFFVLLAPTSSFIPSEDAAFEHRLYLPMLAFSIFAASLIVAIRRPGWVLAPLLIVMAVATVRRGTVWGSEIALWEDTVRHVPNKPRAWFNLAGAYLETDPGRAEVAYRRAIQLNPEFAEAYYNLGIIAQTRKNYSEAAAFYEKALSLNSTHWQAWNNLGNTLLLLGQKERALRAFETTLSLNPDHWPSQYNIAIVHFNSGRFDQAIPRLRTVLDWRPDFRDARYLLAVALTRTGQKVEAEREWQKVGSIIGQPPLPAAIPGPTR
jgi:protein O-mannosyl-transferase